MTQAMLSAQTTTPALHPLATAVVQQPCPMFLSYHCYPAWGQLTDVA